MATTQKPTVARHERGFTLVELLVAIIVIAILAAIFRVPAWASTFDVVASATNYCIEIRHATAVGGNEWRRSTYFGDRGHPQPAPDNCPAAPSL